MDDLPESDKSFFSSNDKQSISYAILDGKMQSLDGLIFLDGKMQSLDGLIFLDGKMQSLDGLIFFNERRGCYNFISRVSEGIVSKNIFIKNRCFDSSVLNGQL